MIDRIKGVLQASLALMLISIPVFGSPSLSTNDDDDKEKNPQNEYVEPGWVIVKFSEAINVPAGAAKTGRTQIDRLADRFQVQSIDRMFPMIDGMSSSKKASLRGLASIGRIHQVKIDEDLDPVQVAEAFHALPEVEYAEPVYRYKITKFSEYPSWMDAGEATLPLVATPNDALFSQQTHMPHIQAPEAWDVVKAEQGNVLVAVLDGGTDWDHADLRGNVFVNTAEIPGNGVDDDDNGFTDDINGWNFPQMSGDPTGLAGTPNNAAHGTQTAGIVAALSDNNNGIAGMTWNGKVLPVNISCETADLSLCFSPGGIFYATIMDADIISASFGGPNRSETVADLVEFAYENETLIIASAGNEGTNNDIIPSFPANYDNVLSVGWTGKNFDTINTFSNFGLSVGVFAPGTGINATAPNGLYNTASGTSFAAPLVAGLAAMVRVQNPTWNIDQVREQVRVTADDISARNTSIKFRNKLGKGRVNALRAVTETSPAVRIRNATLTDGGGSGRIGPGEVATLAVELINHLEPVSNLEVSLASSSQFISIQTPSVTIASLGTGETTSANFTVIASTDVPFNEAVSLNLELTSPAYVDVDVFSVTVNITNHNTGILEMSLNEEGNLGYTGFQGTDGTGFRYQGIDYLFEGGLIMGSGAGKVSDNVRNTTGGDQDNDFVRVEGSNFGIDDGRITTEEGVLELIDSQAQSPNNIQVRLDSYADTSAAYNDFVVLKYTFENVGATAVNNFHAGLFFDWDSSDPGNDFAAYDAARRIGIFRSGDDGVNIGTQILSTSVTPNYRAINNQTELFEDGFTAAEKYAWISGGIQTQTLSQADVSTLTSAGPFTVNPGESVEVAFALVAGADEATMQANADAAQQLWNDSISTLGPNPVSVEDLEGQPAFGFALENPYPNPVREEATIQYEIPTSGVVALTVYDMLGREVRTLVNETVRAGKHTITWDARDNSGNALASGVYMVALTSPSGDGVKTATKKLVLVR